MKKIIAITAVSVVALFAGANSATAYWPGFSGSDVVVTNYNNATVVNNVSADADTGKNDADGGNAQGAGDGGDVNGAGTGNTGGDGGDGGDAGHGGLNWTGNAYADAYVTNTVNSNDTKVVSPCRSCGNGDVNVHNTNVARIMNNVSADADTGKNDADGGDAQGAGDGGDVNGGHSFWFYTSGSDNEAGEGGAGGNGGNGGENVTGHADSYATVVNVINSNVTRIRR